MMSLFHATSAHLFSLPCDVRACEERQKDVLRRKNCAATGDSWTWAKLFLWGGGEEERADGKSGLSFDGPVASFGENAQTFHYFHKAVSALNLLQKNKYRFT